MAWAAVAAAGIGLVGGAILNKGKGGSAAQTGIQTQQQDAAIGNANTLQNMGTDSWDFYTKQYQPLEQSLIGDAMKAGSPGEYARAEDKAMADNNTAFGVARAKAASDQASYGLNPGDGRFQSQLIGLDLAGAAAGAGARNRATQSVADLAWRKKMGVAALGQSAANRGVGAVYDAGRVNAGLSDAAGRNAANAAGNASGTANGLGAIAGGLIDKWNRQTPSASGTPSANYGTIDATQAGVGPW